MSKPNKIELGFGILATVATLVAFGVIIYSTKIYKKPLPQEEIEKQKLIDEAKNIKIPQGVIIENFLCNLKSQAGRLRYLDLSLQLIPFQSNELDKIRMQIPMIKDILIDISAHMAPEELNSVTGKLIFEERVKNKINQSFPQGVVKQILFTKYLVQ